MPDEESVDVRYDSFALPITSGPERPSADHVRSTGHSIVLSAVSRRYGRGKGAVWALRDVSFTVKPGIFGLLGRNGAGKTTLLQTLATLLPPTEGTVRIGPYDLRRDRWAIRSQLGYLPQELGFYPTLTAEETLQYLATLQGLRPIGPPVARALDAVHLGDRARSRVSTLSGGMRRRLGLAQALLGDPPILIVDEPTAGLDPVEQQRFRALLGSLGARGDRTVLLSTHVVADVATIARELVVLEQGRIVFLGGVDELASRAGGKVWRWETRLSTVDGARSRQGLIVSSLSPMDIGESGEPGVIARVVGDRPVPEAIPLAPSLEDGYFAVIGGTDRGAR